MKPLAVAADASALDSVEGRLPNGKRQDDLALFVVRSGA
jgi:hypothetical protein